MATYTDNYNLVKPTMAETADIRTINGNMDVVDDIMHASQISLAPAYDQNETYNTGDVVMYEFLMYECLDDNVTGTWDSTKWQRTTAGEHGGGSDVEITPTLATGTKIADFEIDGVSGELYAPSGGGGASYEELTQAEYNALTPAEKMNGTMYFITDASGGGGSTVVIEGLDYDSAETLTLPDYTGYTYTPTEDGVLMLKAYGSVGGVSIEATGDDTLNLSVLGDTWTCPWIPVNKGTEYTLKRMAQSSSFPNDSWFKFIPWKHSSGGGGGSSEIYDDTERAVGTYFGNTLYKKTIRQTNVSGSPSEWTLIETMSYVDEYVKSEATFKKSNMIYNQYYVSIMFNNSTKGLYYYIREMGSGTSGDLEVTVFYTKSST